MPEQILLAAYSCKLEGKLLIWDSAQVKIYLYEIHLEMNLFPQKKISYNNTDDCWCQTPYLFTLQDNT